MDPFLGLLLPIVTIVAVFTFVTVASWAENRRKEREAYYREETYRKVLEQGGDAGDRILELVRREELARTQRRIEGQRLGGLITMASGIGIMIFLYVLVDEEPVYLVGIIPLLVGFILVVYGFFLASKGPDDERPRRDRS